MDTYVDFIQEYRVYANKTHDLISTQGRLQKIYWVVSLDRARKARRENFAVNHIHGDDVITEHVQ